MVGDTEFLNDLQWLLVEPQDGGVSWPSGLWSVTEVLAAINRVQSEFLRRTEVTAAWAALPVTAGDGTVDLPTDYILTEDAVFADGTSATPLARADDWGLDRAIQTWEGTPGPPIVYAEADAPDLLEALLGPTPSVNGILYLLYVANGAPIANDGTTSFTVPDEATVTILFGVLRDLLNKVGRGEDLARAKYCEQRFEEGVLIWQLLLEGVTG